MYLVSKVSDGKVITCCKRRDIFEMGTIKVNGRFEQNIFSYLKNYLKIETGGKFKCKLIKLILDFEILNKCITY